MRKPALLGGQPAFESLLPIIRPTIVPFEDLQDDLRDIITSGIVTVGPVSRRPRLPQLQHVDLSRRSGRRLRMHHAAGGHFW